ncbi:MAG: diadenylate cyclase CdaA [Bacteroidales bacterium]|nr:diadenylate cyclase CdaA [Bacteroidales bacterium]
MTPLLAALSFISFRIIDVIDILIVAIVLYELYKLTKGTAAVKLFWVIAIFYVIWKVVAYFHFTLLSELLGEVISVGILAIIILFQPEIRKFLLFIGDGRFLHFFSDKLGKKEASDAYTVEVEAVRESCHAMSASKTGALIIFARQTPLDEFLSTGEKLDAYPSAELLENIFFKNSPLHDGAVIIKNHRIAAARCILPVSKNSNLPQEVGLRHRSALGSTEMTDAIAVVVSEQTGTISVCIGGVLTRKLSASELRQLLYDELTQKEKKND